MTLFMIGEDIEAGSSVVRSEANGQLYAAGANARGCYSTYIGEAVERLREGFRAVEKDGEVREDDA